MRTFETREEAMRAYEEMKATEVYVARGSYEIDDRDVFCVLTDLDYDPFQIDSTFDNGYSIWIRDYERDGDNARKRLVYVGNICYNPQNSKAYAKRMKEAKIRELRAKIARYEEEIERLESEVE